MLFASTTKGVGVYIIIIICAKKIIIPTWLLTGIHENVMQSNVFNMDTEGAICVYINGLSLLSRLNLEKSFLN